MTTEFRQALEARYAERAAAARLTAIPEAVAAADALLALGAPVYFHLAGEYGSLFIIGAELRDNDDVYYCDYYGEEFKERWDREDVPISERKVINAFGIRQDVHDILAKHSLCAQWINPGQVGVYQINPPEEV